jgi:hypothetical protein
MGLGDRAKRGDLADWYVETTHSHSRFLSLILLSVRSSYVVHGRRSKMNSPSPLLVDPELELEIAIDVSDVSTFSCLS